MTALSEVVRQEYWTALSTGDRTSAVRLVLAQVDAGVPVETLLIDLVCAAQREVGRLWADNAWGVAREHAATSIGEDVVAALATRAPAPDRGPVLISCVDGEWHALPARVLAETLRAGGWEVHYLGACVPSVHLSQYLHDIDVELVALSASLPTALPRARAMIEAARELAVPVIVGGAGFGRDGRWGMALGANAWAPDAAAARALVARPDWPSWTEPVAPMPHPDEAAAVLARRRGELVADSLADLRERFPPMAAYSEQQTARTVEDLGHIVDFLTAGLFVDDVTLFTDFTTWLGEILLARNVPLPAARLGLEAVARAIGELPRVRQFLAAGLDTLTDRSVEAAS